MLDSISKKQLAAVDSTRARLRPEVAKLRRQHDPDEVGLGLLFMACDVWLRGGIGKDVVIGRLRNFASKTQNGTLPILFEPNQITLRKK